jgi:hypothetical protein
VYLAVAWMHEHRDEFPDPFDAIEQLAADFEYPEELLPLIKFTPVSLGGKPGFAGLEERLAQYIAKKGDQHTNRIEF